jgi:hypothetical protein
VLFQITTIVQDAGDFNHTVLPGPINQKVARAFYAVTGHMIATVVEMVRPRTCRHKVGTFFRTRRCGICAEIAKGLDDQILITQRSIGSKVRQTPSHNSEDVSFRRVGEE